METQVQPSVPVAPTYCSPMPHGTRSASRAMIGKCLQCHFMAFSAQASNTRKFKLQAKTSPACNATSFAPSQSSFCMMPFHGPCGFCQHAGSFAVNPANGQEVPIWVADYVLGGYGRWVHRHTRRSRSGTCVHANASVLAKANWIFSGCNISLAA